jgi:hypothetical protein
MSQSGLGIPFQYPQISKSQLVLRKLELFNIPGNVCVISPDFRERSSKQE